MLNSSATLSAVAGIASIPYFVNMAGFGKRQPMVLSSNFKFREKAVSDFPNTKGARDILSTPPAMTTSTSPLFMHRAALITASRLEPQSRFTVTPGTSFGSPASNGAIRAMFRLSSPAWFAHPKMTSSIRFTSNPGFLSTIDFITSAARSSGRTDASAPPYLPNGVRIPSHISASRMIFPIFMVPLPWKLCASRPMLAADPRRNTVSILAIVTTEILQHGVNRFRTQQRSPTDWTQRKIHAQLHRSVQSLLAAYMLIYQVKGLVYDHANRAHDNQARNVFYHGHREIRFLKYADRKQQVLLCA